MGGGGILETVVCVVLAQIRVLALLSLSAAANEEKSETILASSFTVRHFHNPFVATA